VRHWIQTRQRLALVVEYDGETYGTLQISLSDEPPHLAGVSLFYLTPEAWDAK
jgi:hypothetical protein